MLALLSLKGCVLRVGPLPLVDPISQTIARARACQAWCVVILCPDFAPTSLAPSQRLLSAAALPLAGPLLSDPSIFSASGLRPSLGFCHQGDGPVFALHFSSLSLCNPSFRLVFASFVQVLSLLRQWRRAAASPPASCSRSSLSPITVRARATCSGSTSHRAQPPCQSTADDTAAAATSSLWAGVSACHCGRSAQRRRVLGYDKEGHAGRWILQCA